MHNQQHHYLPTQSTPTKHPQKENKMDEQIKKLQGQLALLGVRHDEANRLTELAWGSDQWDKALVLEEESIIDLAVTTISLYLTYYNRDRESDFAQSIALRLGHLITHLDTVVE